MKSKKKTEFKDLKTWLKLALNDITLHLKKGDSATIYFYQEGIGVQLRFKSDSDGQPYYDELKFGKIQEGVPTTEYDVSFPVKADEYIHVLEELANTYYNKLYLKK